ncbi:MAG: hypothetical protein ACM31C_11340 [Acidobacteriota bacterium]
MKIVLVLVLVLGCSRRAPISSCADDLHGVWRDGSGASWMILDDGATLEAYALFADAVGSGELAGAPRAIDLARTADRLDGTIHRRFERRADSCDAHVPIHVTACKDDTLEIVLADPAAPVELAPCRWGAIPPARVERWRRQ